MAERTTAARGMKRYASDCEIVLAYRRAEQLVALRAVRNVKLAESVSLLAASGAEAPLAEGAP